MGQTASIEVTYEGDSAFVHTIVTGSAPTRIRIEKPALLSFARLLLNADTDVADDIRLALRGTTPAAPVREQLTQEVLRLLVTEHQTRGKVAQSLGRDRRDASVRRAFRDLEADGLIAQNRDDYTWHVLGLDVTTRDRL